MFSKVNEGRIKRYAYKENIIALLIGLLNIITIKL